MTFSPGLRPSTTSTKSGLRRPSRTLRRTAAAAGRHHEDPVAAGVLIEGAVGQHHGLRGAAQLDPQVDRLADMDAGGRGAVEIKIRP